MEALLTFLKKNKKVDSIGLEIDAANIQHCIKNGVNVIEQNLDKGLSNFETDSFDTVVLTQTLQALSRPDKLIEEMLRIGKRGIVTFPNFGNWRSRIYLASKGRMPISKFIPYQWYNTPNIHFCTVKDFDELCANKKIKVLARMVVTPNTREIWEQGYYLIYWEKLQFITSHAKRREINGSYGTC